jgi:GlpG protein
MASVDQQLLVHIAHHNIALLFANYLSTLNIQTKVIEESQGFAIYCDRDQLPLAQSEFEQFIKQPHQPKYQQAAWQHAIISDVKEHHPAFMTIFKQQFLAHAGVITLFIFVICWLVFVFSLAGFERALFNQLQFFPRLSLALLFSEPLRLIGPAFFHFSLLHIAFNTMWWWQLGGSIEKSLGKMTLINLFLVSAIASNLGQFIVSGPYFGGLSGVVYALVGFVWWMGWLAPEKGLSLSKPIIGFLLLWLVLGFADVLPVNVANTAHLLGLVSGCLMALVKVKVIKFTE